MLTRLDTCLPRLWNWICYQFRYSPDTLLDQIVKQDDIMLFEYIQIGLGLEDQTQLEHPPLFAVHV